MGTQASVRSIDALRDFRVALALFSEETLGALGAVDMEIKRTVFWLQQDRPAYWQEQIKRRREGVAAARAEVFRRKLAATADHTPAHSEQKELLRRAEESLREAEMRYALVRKWGPALQQAVLEYHASTRRIKDLAAGDVPRAVALLERLVDALEEYLRVAVPSTAPAGTGSSAATTFDSIAGAMLDEEPEDVGDAAPGAGEGDDGAAPPPPETPA